MMRLTDDARHSSPGEVQPGKMAAHAIHYAKEGKQWALTNAGGRKPRSVSISGMRKEEDRRW